MMHVIYIVLIHASLSLVLCMHVCADQCAGEHTYICLLVPSDSLSQKRANLLVLLPVSSRNPPIPTPGAGVTVT